jgi:hypothetical protein
MICDYRVFRCVIQRTGFAEYSLCGYLSLVSGSTQFMWTLLKLGNQGPIREIDLSMLIPRFNSGLRPHYRCRLLNYRPIRQHLLRDFYPGEFSVGLFVRRL